MSEPTTPQPYPSWKWVVNEIGHGFWDSPVPHPIKNKAIFAWNEEKLTWEEM